MDGIIEVRSVDQISNYSNMLGSVYSAISNVNNELAKDHEIIKQCWVDKRVDEFSANFATASDYIWQLLIAISNMQEFLSYAAEGYSATEKQVSSL